MTAGSLPPGTVLGSYEIQEELGRGALGVVYRSRHIHLGRPVALKVMHPYWSASREFVERFREEGRALALMEHPNILRVYDAGASHGILFLAMQYLEGHTLEQLLPRGLPLHGALYIARQVAGALAYAHSRGVIHRDVKPANIMVSPQGEVTLMDFGVARLRNSPGLTLPGVQIGTPFYMAPELILGQGIDARVDLYALGVVFHQMISGSPPFPGPDTETVFRGHVNEEPPSLGKDCPEWVRRVVRKALAKGRDDRFASAASFLKALTSNGDERILAETGVGPLEAAATPAPAPLPRADLVARPVPGDPNSTKVIREDRAVLSLGLSGSPVVSHPGMSAAGQQRLSRIQEYVRGRLDAHACLAFEWSAQGLTALFTKPVQAARAAQDLLDGLPAFNSAAGAEPVRLRVGAHSGLVTMTEGQPLSAVASPILEAALQLRKLCAENNALVSERAYSGLPKTDNWTLAGPEYHLAFEFPVYRYTPPAVSAPVVSASAAAAPAAGSAGQTPARPSARPTGAQPARAPVPGSPWAPLPLPTAGQPAPPATSPATRPAASPSAVSPPPASPPPASPPPARKASLLRLAVTAGRQRSELVVQAEALIGRSDLAVGRAPDIDVRHDSAASRRHARLFPREGEFFVEDLGSANGTSVNGRYLSPRTPARLKRGDRVEVGEATVIEVLGIDPAP